MQILTKFDLTDRIATWFRIKIYCSGKLRTLSQLGILRLNLIAMVFLCSSVRRKERLSFGHTGLHLWVKRSAVTRLYDTRVYSRVFTLFLWANPSLLPNDGDFAPRIGSPPSSRCVGREGYPRNKGGPSWYPGYARCFVSSSLSPRTQKGLQFPNQWMSRLAGVASANRTGYARVGPEAETKRGCDELESLSLSLLSL